MSTIPDSYKGAGYGTIYSDAELRQAIANAEVANLIGKGGSADPAFPSASRLSDGTNYYKALSEGTPADGVTGPTGGSGAFKWLSGIWAILFNVVVGDRVKVQSTGITKGITEVSQSYTRPSDTTAYVANDALSNSVSAPIALTFANIGRVNGGSGYLVNIVCYTSQIAFAGALRLHLFKGSSAAIAINDNSPYPLLTANNINRIGYVDFTSFSTGGTGSDSAISIGEFPQGRLIPFSCDTGNSNIYGLVEVRTGFTPTPGQIFGFYIGVEQN